MHIVAIIVWVTFVFIVSFCGRELTMTWNNRIVPDTVSNRLIGSTLFFPAVGLVFWVLGAVGKFMISPIVALF